MYMPMAVMKRIDYSFLLSELFDLYRNMFIMGFH